MGVGIEGLGFKVEGFRVRREHTGACSEQWEICHPGMEQARHDKHHKSQKCGMRNQAGSELQEGSQQHGSSAGRGCMVGLNQQPRPSCT